MDRFLDCNFLMGLDSAGPCDVTDIAGRALATLATAATFHRDFLGNLRCKSLIIGRVRCGRRRRPHFAATRHFLVESSLHRLDLTAVVALSRL